MAPVEAAPTPAAPTPVAVPTQPSSTPTTEPTTAPITTSSDNMLVSGSEYQTAVAEMEAMGFQRESIERAMAASFMNPHRAIDYLFNPASMPEIPAAPQGGEQPAQPTTPAATTEPASNPAPPAAAPTAGSLDFLRSQPQVNNHTHH